MPPPVDPTTRAIGVVATRGLLTVCIGSLGLCAVLVSWRLAVALVCAALVGGGCADLVSAFRLARKVQRKES